MQESNVTNSPSPDPTPTPTPTPSAVHYAVVGASDALGIGASTPCFVFEDCAGTGYAPIIKRRFQSDGATVQLSNRGIPGAVLSQTFLMLARDLGRDDVRGTYLDQIVPFVPTTATHISIFAGGNDAGVIGENIRAGRGLSDLRAYVDERVAEFGRDFGELITRVRARAPSARIAVMNLPNLAAAPYVSHLIPLDKSILQRIAVGITDRINANAGPNVVIVDLMCEPRVYSAANFSADGYHPNDAGYALMAELLYPALRSGTATAPSANCPQRTLLPPF